jgi:tetratricopeptide (TPR) repeat protein
LEHGEAHPDENMKQPLVAAGSLNRLLQAAEAAWEQGGHQECIESLQRAHRLAPSNTGILLRLGHMLGLRYDYAPAESCFEKALRLAPKKIEMLTEIADQCLNFRNPEIGERFLRRAVEQPDATPRACVQLAELCERLRRLPEAAQLVQRALTLNSAYPPALIVHARLERQAGRLEAAEQGMRSLLTRPHPDDWTHAQGWYELAAILDRQQKYDEAMTAFNQAKSFFRPMAGRPLAELKMLRSRLKVMEANVSSELFQRWFDDGAALLPARRLALLCGHARSGTTLLEQVLDAHPDIVSAEETTIFLEDAYEPLRRNHPPDAYMLPVLEAAGVPALQQSRAAYFRSMDLAIGKPVAGRLLLDKNPALTFTIPAFVRIFPETKFLVALRDPRDVVLSCFMQNLPLTQMGAAYLTLEGTVEDYTRLMNNWLTLSPLIPGHCLVVRYEDMVEDLESVARKTLEFLGVPWDAKVLGFDEHARQKTVRSPTYADVTQPVYKRAVGRWHNYQKYLEPHLQKLEPFVKAFGYE